MVPEKRKTVSGGAEVKVWELRVKFGLGRADDEDVVADSRESSSGEVPVVLDDVVESGIGMMRLYWA